jgi:hypothetical protein
MLPKRAYTPELPNALVKQALAVARVRKSSGRSS